MITNRYAVVMSRNGFLENESVQWTWQVGRKKYQYLISYAEGIHVAQSLLPFPLFKGDLVLIERSTNGMTIVARLNGDSFEGTPYQGNGGVIAPHDAPGAGSSTIPPVFTSGWLEFDTGPGLDAGKLYP